jgi:hypothetical protein
MIRMGFHTGLLYLSSWQHPSEPEQWTGLEVTHFAKDIIPGRGHRLPATQSTLARVLVSEVRAWRFLWVSHHAWSEPPSQP